MHASPAPWETDAEVVLDEWVDDSPPAADPADHPNWRTQALRATDLDTWAQAAFQVDGTANALADAAATRRWYEHVIGSEFDPGATTGALEALARYVSAVADGASKTAAITAARKSFKAALEEIPF